MRHWVVLILFLLALGALRMVGCGDASPCGNCDDGNSCTRDSCASFDVGDICEATEHSCQNPPVTDGTPCGSGDVCVEGVCGENLCEGVVCEDDDICTDDTCDYADGLCKFPPTVCDDGDGCTVDRCIPPDGCDFTTIAEDGAFCSSEDIQPVNLGLCKAGVCVAPCDPASVEVTPCPVEGRGDILLCCPGAEACESHCDVGAFEVQP
jgi:hypothetical protein